MTSLEPRSEEFGLGINKVVEGITDVANITGINHTNKRSMIVS